MPIRKTPSDKVIKHDYLEKRMSSGDMANEYGVSRGTMCKHLKRLGITRPESGTNSRNRRFDKKQYRRGYPVTFNPDHPRANHLGYVFNHIINISKKLGYVPNRSQPVHHIDMDSKNDEINNLHLFSSHRKHKLSHGSFNKLAKPLLNQGIIRFNRKTEKYELI